MGLFKRYHESQEWKREEMDGSRPSLSGQVTSWLDSKPDSTKKAVLVTLAGAFVLGLIFTLAYGAITVSTHQDSGYSDTSENTESDKTSPYASYFQNIENWPFLRTTETITKVENSIYSELLAGGLTEGEFVVIQDSYEQVEGGYTGYFRDTPRGKTWKAFISTADWSVTIEESALPDPPGADLIEPDDAEDEQTEDSAAAQDATTSQDGSATTTDTSQTGSSETQSTQEATAAQDATTTQETEESGITLSDSSALAEILPEHAASQAANSLIKGASESYGFTASASKSYILPSSVEVSGNNCSFTAVLCNAQGEKIQLSVNFDAETGRFTGSKL